MVAVSSRLSDECAQCTLNERGSATCIGLTPSPLAAFPLAPHFVQIPCSLKELTEGGNDRYYQPWKDAQSLVDVSSEERGNAWGLTFEGYRPRASGDKALTAFAQLAALRLNVRRAMVSLIDSTHQIILAEATRTLSLVSDQRHEPGDEVWLGNTIINRHDAVCFNSLSAQYTAKDKEGRSYTSDAFVVPDLRLHDNFKDKDYVKGDPGVKFYAGVPIKTKSGHRIGVYAVSDEKPRFGLDIDELMFMEDVAATVMEHLEMAKDRDDRHKGERMVRGLANFIEGSTDAPEPPSRRPSRTISRKTSMQELKVLSPRLPAVMERQTENAKLENDDTAGLPTMQDFAEKKKQEEAAKQSPPTDDQDPFRVFARAAQIIRDSTAADGVVFFNTNARAFSDSASTSGASEEHGDESQGQTSGSDLLSSEATVKERPRRRRQNSNFSTHSEQQPKGLDTEANSRKVRCEVAGLSKTEGAEGSNLSVKDFILTEERMERYIRNFPYGKFFSFTDTGSGISSSGDEGSQEDSSTMLTPRRNQSQPHRRSQGGVKSRKKEPLVPTELLRVLPGIRSLIFLPLWDFTEGKYIAAGFIWTTSAGRLMSPDHELPYLKAFGNSVMSEVARVNAQRADFAKTTFIASISHELRSPLHGILGSVEFLHDTAANAYQAALFTSIDTCGRTLLDTIDHVLDYAKINKLRKGGVKRNSRGSRMLQKPETGSSVVGLTADFDLAGLVEEVVDAVTAGHAFKKTHSQSVHDHDDSGTSTPASPGKGTSKPREDPAVILNIDHRDNWFVRTQPGALRRITMNLLGNALKYTDSGFVSVSLQLDSEDDNGLKIRLRFVDSGKGMSVEFQRTKLFAPFSQEDPFAAGTGLGLSIVRQIVDSLNGSINVRSTQNVGTEIDVVMHLPIADQPPAPQLNASVARATRGMSLHLNEAAEHAEESYFSQSNKRAINKVRVRDSLYNTCSDWFGMKVSDPDCRNSEGAEDIPSNPDVVCYHERPVSAETVIQQFTSAGAYGHGDAKKRSAPVIVICSNASQASSFRSNEAQQLRKMGIHVEPVTQPCGPRKMAAVLQKCLDVINDRHGQPGHFAARRIMQSQHLERNASAPEVLTQQDNDSDSRHEGSPLLLTPSQSSVDTESSIALGLPASRDTTEAATATVQPLTTAAKPQQHLTRLDDIPPTVRSSSAPDLTSQPTVIPAIPPASHRPSLQSHESAPMAIDTIVPPPSGPRILLVDDNAINLQLLVMFMKKHKFDFACASNGLEALEKYKEATPKSSYPHGRRSSKAAVFENASNMETRDNGESQPSDPEQRPFSHILMDLSMPIMDGLTSTRHIRAHESSTGMTPPATVIALTGLASAEAQEDALAAGVDRFLVKPVRLGQLKGLLLGGDR